MRIVVQKVLESNVKVDGKVVGQIGKGLMLLVAFTQTDTEKEIDYMINKVTNLRIFEDENDIMNLSIKDVGGELLSISQFTLYGDAKKGNRPSYIEALNGEEASKLYDLFNKKLNDIIHTETGIFGADMKVSLINDGPCTILLEK
jgi:D-tyrosyl-tRNA(Tyr) deacylase